MDLVLRASPPVTAERTPEPVPAAAPPAAVTRAAAEPPDVDVVVPVWNEEARIGTTLAALTTHAATMGRSVVVSVVDNGSVDRTAELVDACAATMPSNVRVRLLGCSRQGKGAAVRRGVLASTARWVGYCDADLATPVRTLDTVVAELERGESVVIGSRRCTGAAMPVPQPLARRVGSAGFRLLTRALAAGVADSQCGFKFFSSEAARAVFSRCTVDGFSFDVEVLGVAARLGYSVLEVPVSWSDRAGSSFGLWADGRRVLTELRQVRASVRRTELR